VNTLLLALAITAQGPFDLDLRSSSNSSILSREDVRCGCGGRISLANGSGSQPKRRPKVSNLLPIPALEAGIRAGVSKVR
jgi:hypothetical protein